MTDQQKVIDLAKLREPFPPADIEWRVGRSGKHNGKFWAQVLAYITNRAIMDRLDEVCGPENWRNEYQPWHTVTDKNKCPIASQICGISIRINGEWVTKWDGASNTDIESVKGGLSDAMKRAAVQWGIGRYLYDLGDSYAQIDENGSRRDRIKWKEDGKDHEDWVKWNPPRLPSWAVSGSKPPADSGNGHAQEPHSENKPASTNGNGKAANGKPASPPPPTDAKKKWEAMPEADKFASLKKAIAKERENKARLEDLQTKVPEQGLTDEHKAELLRLIEGLWVIEDWAPHDLPANKRIAQITECLGKARSYEEIRAVKFSLPFVFTDAKAIAKIIEICEETLKSDPETANA
jgi:hypothetical protein